MLAFLGHGQFPPDAFGLAVKLAATGVPIGQLAAQRGLAAQRIDLRCADSERHLACACGVSGDLFLGVVKFEIAQRCMPAEAIPLTQERL